MRKKWNFIKPKKEKIRQQKLLKKPTSTSDHNKNGLGSQIKTIKLKTSKQDPIGFQVRYA